MLRSLRREVLGCALGIGLALLGAPSPAVAGEPIEEGPPAPPAPRTVRVHFRGVARIELAGINGAGGPLVCESPCTADVAAGTQLHAVRKGSERFPYAFGVPNDPGGEEDIEVSGASSLPLILGVALAVVGTPAVALGALSMENGRGEHGGHALFGGGLVTVAVGVVLLATRSKEPRVTIDLTHVAQLGSGLSF